VDSPPCPSPRRVELLLDPRPPFSGQQRTGPATRGCYERASNRRASGREHPLQFLFVHPYPPRGTAACRNPSNGIHDPSRGPTFRHDIDNPHPVAAAALRPAFRRPEAARPSAPLPDRHSQPHAAGGPCRHRHPCRPHAPRCAGRWQRRGGGLPAPLLRLVPDRARSADARPESHAAADHHGGRRHHPRTRDDGRRHGYWHPRREAEGDLRCLLAGRCLDDARVRGDRSRDHDQRPTGRVDGWPHLGALPGGRGQRVPRDAAGAGCAACRGVAYRPPGPRSRQRKPSAARPTSSSSRTTP